MMGPGPMQNTLVGQRVLITQSTVFMGPALCEVFAEQGASVVASAERLSEPEAAQRVVRDAGYFDILVANLAFTAPTTAATEVSEDEWRDVFAALVDPLPRLVRAAVPATAANCFVGQVFPVCGGWVAR